MLKDVRVTSKLNERNAHNILIDKLSIRMLSMITLSTVYKVLIKCRALKNDS